MPHFLINSNCLSGGVLKVSDPGVIRHLCASLRVKKGEMVNFIDENEVQYFSEILEISKNEILAKVLKAEKSIRKLDFEIYLAQSVLKPDAEHLLISNAAELGVKGVFPFISEFSAVKENFVRQKIEKWQKIADEAFKQCERADRMQVFEISPLLDILKKFEKNNIIVFAEKYSNISVFGAAKKISPGGKILVVTGPEGGFSENEFDFFKKQGFALATLGNLILRAPNAVTCGVTRVICALENRESADT